MKKLLLLVCALWFLVPAAAQHVTNYNTKAATLYHGKPKRLIEMSEGYGVCITEFDENGRITSEKLDKYDYTFRYRWTESKIVLTVCNDADNVLNTVEMEYEEEPGRLFIDGGKMGTIEFLFNENETLAKVIFNKNGQQGSLTAEYTSDDPYCCTAFDMVLQGKAMGKAYNEYVEWDDAGNPTECVQRTNDNTVTIRRRITYYDEQP